MDCTSPVVRNKHAWAVDIRAKCQGSQCDSESLSEKFQLDFTPNYCNLFGEVKLLYCAAKPVYKVRLFTYKNIVRKTLGRNRLKIDSVWGSKWKQSKHFISNLMLCFHDVVFVKMWCLKACYVSHSSDFGNLISSLSLYGCFLEISSLSENDILVLRLDLTDRSSHEAATNSVLKHFGKVRCASGVKLLFLCLLDLHLCSYFTSVLLYDKFRSVYTFLQLRY